MLLLDGDLEGTRARAPSLARSLAQSGSSFPRALRRGFWFPPDGSVRWLCLAEPRAGLVDFSLALSFCNRSPPPPLQHAHIHTHRNTHTLVSAKFISPALYLYIFSFANFPLSVLSLNGVAVDYRIPVRAEGKGGNEPGQRVRCYKYNCIYIQWFFGV